MALEIKGLFNPTSVSIPTSHLAEIMDGGEEPTDSFTVTKNLSHCAISNEQIGEASYYAEIAPTGGWSDLQVTIKVGGVDMSEYYSSGVINIPNVTGNIVITATAAAAPLVSIAATYTQSGTVYDTDSLDSLKSDLVVTANYEDGTSSTVSDYTLSGTLAEGTSTITVSYGGKTTTFNVVVTEYAINLFEDATIITSLGGGAGTITETENGVLMESRASARWSLYYQPSYADISLFTKYGNLKGHTIRAVVDIETTGNVVFNVLLTSDPTSTGTRLKNADVPFTGSGTRQETVEFVLNDAFLSSGSGGTDDSYVTFRVFLNANSGVNALIKEFTLYDIGVLS